MPCIKPLIISVLITQTRQTSCWQRHTQLNSPHTHNWSTIAHTIDQPSRTHYWSTFAHTQLINPSAHYWSTLAHTIDQPSRTHNWSTLAHIIDQPSHTQLTNLRTHNWSNLADESSKSSHDSLIDEPLHAVINFRATNWELRSWTCDPRSTVNHRADALCEELMHANHTKHGDVIQQIRAH